MMIGTMLGWILIGAAASLAGMIWPFRRGAAGVVVNLVAGVLGALAGGLIGQFALSGARAEPARLLFAAVGALVALGLVHGAWIAASAWRSGRVHGARPRSEGGAPSS